MYVAPSITDLGSVVEHTLEGSTRQQVVTKDLLPNTDGSMGLGFLGPGSGART